MQTPEDRLTNLMDSIVGKLKMGDKIKCQASGPQVVIAPNPANGQAEIQIGWQFSLWLEHDKLIGQDPVGVSGAMGGAPAQPPQPLLEGIVKNLLEQARDIRAKANNPMIATPTADDMIASMRDMSQA